MVLFKRIVREQNTLVQEIGGAFRKGSSNPQKVLSLFEFHPELALENSA